MGTKGPLNFRQLIFDHISKHAGSSAVKKPVGFLSLIFGILQSQLDIVATNDVFEGAAADVVITTKLKNSEYHINDIQVIFDDDDHSDPFPLPSKSIARGSSNVPTTISVIDSIHILSVSQDESQHLLV